jgi:uncharacterized protein (TIGR00255 family)
MTGYARLSGEDQGFSWVWEVKSVNSRGLELRTKLPNGFDFLDLPVRDAAQKRFKRGNINIGLTIMYKSQAAPLAVNEVLLDQLVSLARRWQEKAPDLAPPRLDGLLALKGVLENDDSTGPRADDPELLSRLLQGCEKTLAQMETMRAEEGARLARVLEGLLSEIEHSVRAATLSAALDPEHLKGILRQQVAALLEAGASVSEERLAQEIALILAKADVREELDRLSAHSAAARKMLQGGEPVGRKLDFLCQEFNREANTLCSKANDIGLTSIGLALKVSIEQFREQVQNIE